MKQTHLEEYTANLLKILAETPKEERDLNLLKNRAAAITPNTSNIYKKTDILKAMTPEQKQRWGHYFMKRPSRNDSGVAIIPVMTSPSDCPHGKCIFCPGGLNRDNPEESTPQSYIKESPSVIKALAFDYNPYQIVRKRLYTENAIGHTTEKIEGIVQGGTFPGRSLEYQDYFMYCFYQALNDGPDSDGGTPPYTEQEFRIMPRSERLSRISEALETNETATHRCIGLTVETKPDMCLKEHIDNMLNYGVTRIELGVQTLQDQVLHAVNRGHGLQEIKDAFTAIKTAGLKVCIHMMPGLPGNTPETDIQDIKELFDNEAYQPDMLKIYPTLVLKGQKTTLNKWFEEGKYESYTNEEISEVMAHAMGYVPEWVRLNRYQRGFQQDQILSGPTAPNLRQLIEKRMQELGYGKPREIRAREVAKHVTAGGTFNPRNLTLIRREYPASAGKEIFLTLEDKENDVLVGFVRLRIETKAWRPEHQTKNQTIAFIRELRIYGLAQNLGQQDTIHLQHQGYGKQLMEAAEKIAKQEYQTNKISVIAGVGVRQYYQEKLGYQKAGAYMNKTI